MKNLFFIFFIFLSGLHANYMDNHSCKECHKNIYEEYESSARAKFLRIVITRKDKVIWQNYVTSPKEDKQAYFAYRFTKEGKPIVIPSQATEGSVHNLPSHAAQRLIYQVPALQKGDVIEVTLYVQLAKSECASAIVLTDQSLLKPQVIQEVRLSVP